MSPAAILVRLRPHLFAATVVQFKVGPRQFNHRKKIYGGLIGALFDPMLVFFF